MNIQEEQYCRRLRTLSADFSLQHHNLQKIVNANEQVISEQSKLITRLTQQQRQLSEQNNMLSLEVVNLRNQGSEEVYDRIFAQNIQLSKKVEELELILAKTKVQSAAKQEQILLTQLELNRLSSNSERQLSIQGYGKGLGSLSRSKIVRIVDNGKPNRSDSFQGKENYSDDQFKQWIKYLQLKQSSQQSTIIKIKDKCKSIIKRFIPKQLRRLAWPLFIQNKLSLTPALYNHFQQIQVNQKIKAQIHKDIERWFILQGENNQPFVDDLQEILEVFHCYRPDVSYVQGMTYPAGILLMTLDKYKAWQCCCNILLTNQVMYNLYTFNLQKIALYCRTFDYILSQHCESITLKLQQLDLHSQIYLIQWFYTMFSRSFSLPTVFKIWDLFTYHGQAILYRVSIGIFDQLKGLIQKLDYDECIETIKNFNVKIDEQRLLEFIIEHKLTTEKLRNHFSKVQQLTDSRGDIS